MSWTYYLPDALGSVRQLADERGNVVQTVDYSPFGQVTAVDGERADPYRFAGEHWDADAGLLYLRARWYNPATGRFLSQDPFPGLLPLPQTLHPYLYVLNDPVNLTDPSGQVPLIIPILVSALTGALVGATVGGASSAISYVLEHPCEDVLHSPGFWDAVKRGAISGGVSGALTGALVPVLLPLGSTLLGSIGMAGALGGLGSGVNQIVNNVLNPNAAWYEGVPEAVGVGIVLGMVFGAAGYGVKQWLARRAARAASGSTSSQNRIRVSHYTTAERGQSIMNDGTIRPGPWETHVYMMRGVVNPQTAINAGAKGASARIVFEVFPHEVRPDTGSLVGGALEFTRPGSVFLDGRNPTLAIIDQLTR